MITLMYTGVDSSEWTLVGERQGAQGAEAKDVKGFVASIDATVEARPARTGHVVSGFTVPPMTGTLDLTVSSQLVDDETRELDEIFDALARAWSPLVDGELTWVSDRGVLMRTRARAPCRITRNALSCASCATSGQTGRFRRRASSSSSRRFARR